MLNRRRFAQMLEGESFEMVRPSRFELLTFCFGGKPVASVPFVSHSLFPAQTVQYGTFGANCGGICGGRSNPS